MNFMSGTDDLVRPAPLRGPKCDDETVGAIELRAEPKSRIESTAEGKWAVANQQGEPLIVLAAVKD
jgi:hypothetical protein